MAAGEPAELGDSTPHRMRCRPTGAQPKPVQGKDAPGACPQRRVSDNGLSAFLTNAIQLGHVMFF